MYLLLLPSSLQFLVVLIAIVGVVLFVWSIYKLILGPAFKSLSDIHTPPPDEGYVYEFTVDSDLRRKSVTIGQFDSNIKTRMAGIKESHLTINFVKDRELEDYDIKVIPGGALFYRAAHTKTMELIKSEERFDSRELIGHPAAFRLAAKVKEKRALQYIEFELSTRYYFTSVGEEKMRFFITLTKVFPGVDRSGVSKRGIYPFSRRVESTESKEEEE